MKFLLGICCIAILFLQTSASADNSNDVSNSTKQRIKREPATVVHVNRPPLRPKKSHGPPRSKYGPNYNIDPYDGPGPSKIGPSRPKYSSSKFRPSKSPYGSIKNKHRSPKDHGYNNKPSYRPPKHGSSYYAPQHEEEEEYGFGEPPLSFGEPPGSSFPNAQGYGNGYSGSSFEELSDYEEISPSSPYKKYRKPIKKPHDYRNGVKTMYEDEDAFDNVGYSGEPNRFEPFKNKRPYSKPISYGNRGKESYSTQSITFYNKPKGYTSPFDNPENYEAQESGYPDEALPYSDYFGAPISGPGNAMKHESYNDEENDSIRSSSTNYRRPIKEITIVERPKKIKRPQKVKVVKVRTLRKKPKTRHTDEGHYSEPPRKLRKQQTDYSPDYDTSFAGSNVAYTAVAPSASYNNVKGASVDFSPQNINDAFTANKRLEAGYIIELTDNQEAPSQMGTIVAQAPNYPYNYKDTSRGNDFKITKSLSHDYYAGVVTDPSYTSTLSPGGDSNYYRSNQENVLSPNYFDFSDANFPEKNTPKYRDVSLISLRNDDSKPSAMRNYDDNIKNHRTQ